MLKAKKKNRVIRIPETAVTDYKSLGYTITDETGRIVYEPEDKDATIASLRKENAMLKQKIAEYELLMSKPENTKEKKTEKAKT